MDERSQIEEDAQKIESDEDKSNQSILQAVKSNAIFKYSAVDTPATFSRLQCNTDIKKPPSNWLNSSGELYGLNHVLSHSSAFSSFRMANQFPDCVGEVDVVSDSENIKKLLKIPYSTKPVSMMIHRVENTLLIDEFDIHKHLLSKSESEWTWLKKFFCEQIFQNLKNKCLIYKNNTRTALQEQALVSKFLHYSIAEPPLDDLVAQSFTNSFPLTPTGGPTLPEPPLEEGLPDPETSFDRKFTRNVVWTFEDIQMLLGTDLPIFGGPTRPCISLRLRDATKPINVLTGIDYWLDNLMSNVPEVLMCYHIDGIVQKYELIKTEDLPQLPKSKFSPGVIRDVAQNILSFLKVNATKAGHTYWLFKGKDEDVVKLYDLTSLCSETLEEKDENPFTIPVGMLLYRVARSMYSSEQDKYTSATIRMLLENCISLLPKEKYPEIVSSAHYLLAEVYIPSGTDPTCPLLENIPPHSQFHEEEEVKSSTSNSVSVRSLQSGLEESTENKYQPPPPISGSIEERCLSALQHVLGGLECLKYSKGDKENEMTEQPKMANPTEAIPMPFTKEKFDEKEKTKKNGNQIDHSLKSLLCRLDAETVPRWKKSDKVDSSMWKKHLSSLLYNKACLIYSILSVKEMEAKRFRLALKHICGVLRCSDDNYALARTMLFMAGDSLYEMWNEAVESFDEEDCYPEVTRPHPIPHSYELNLLMAMDFDGPEALLISSSTCYLRCHDIFNSTVAAKRLGNSYNELGKIYCDNVSDLAMQLIRQETTDKEEVKQALVLLTRTHTVLQDALNLFRKIQDNNNISMVICNVAKLNRVEALLLDLDSSHQLKHHALLRAVKSYTEARSVIGSRKLQPDIWDSISWDLSTTYFDIAKNARYNLLKDGEEHKEVINHLQEAVEHCDITTNSARLPLYQYRAATLYFWIASIYSNIIRKGNLDNKKKSYCQLLNTAYERSYNLFMTLDYPDDVIKLQLDRIDFSEFLASETKSQHFKSKHYSEAINLIIKCRKALINCSDVQEEHDSGCACKGGKLECDNEGLFETLKKLEKYFQRVLLTLIKLNGSMTNKKETTDMYKDVYRLLLKKEKNTKTAAYLVKVIDKIIADVKP